MNITIFQKKADFDKHMSDTGRLLGEFKRRGQLNTADLYKYGTGCSSRVYELRKEGHIIVADYLGNSVWRYTYKGQTEIFD